MKGPEMFSCQARILNEKKDSYWTTKECCVETSKRISVDEGDAFMSICSCCFKRFIKRKIESNWFGWFDCEYPPEARVVGSKWYYENVASVKALPTPAPETKEVEEEKICQAFSGLSIEQGKKEKKQKKEEINQKIKEIQKNANPGKMTLKEIQAAFKQITDLKAQIHML